MEDAIATCPACGSEIQDWVSTCPSCHTGLEWAQAPDDQIWTDEDEYDDHWSRPPRPPRRRPRWLISGVLIAVLVACVCVVCLGTVAFGFLLTGSDSLTVAEVTATPSLAAPAFEQICAQMETLTQAQWEQYAQELKGATAATWTGWVADVKQRSLGGYELWIDMDAPGEPFSVQDVQFDIPEELALQLEKDQQVTFSGTIVSVMNILGSCQVTLKDARVSPPETPPAGN